MQLLVLEFRTTGSEAQINEIVAYGYELLNDSLNILEEGSGMVRLSNMTDIIGEISVLGKPRKDFLDLLESICYDKTILASRSVMEVYRFWEEECFRHGRFMPKNLSSRTLDVGSLEFLSEYKHKLDLNAAARDRSIYDIMGEVSPFIEPCYAAAKATAELLRHKMLSDHIIELRKPYERDIRSS